MITDNEIDQLANEFKAWRKERMKKNPPTGWVSDGTCPNAGTSITYKYPNNVISKESIENQPYNRLQKIIDRMRDTVEELRKDGALNYALSLEGQINDLVKLIAGIE